MLLEHRSYSYSNTTTSRLVVLGWGERLTELMLNCHELTGVLFPSTEWLIEDVLSAFNSRRSSTLGHRGYWFLELETNSYFNDVEINEFVSGVERLLNEELDFLKRRLIYDSNVELVAVHGWCRITTGGIEPILEIKQRCVNAHSYLCGITRDSRTLRLGG